MTDDLQNNQRLLETMTPKTGRIIKENNTIANIADCFAEDDEGNLSLRTIGGGVNIIETTPEEGADLAVNGGFENWTGGVPDDWTVGTLGSGSATGAVITEETGEFHSGAKSAKSTSSDDGTVASYVEQVFTGLTPNGTYIVGGWGKLGTASHVVIRVYDGALDENPYVWDFDNEDWVAPSTNPAGANLVIGDSAESWTDNAGVVVMPSDGTELHVIAGVSPDGETANLTGYIDDITLIPYERPETTVSGKALQVTQITRDVELGDDWITSLVPLYTIPTGYEFITVAVGLKTTSITNLQENPLADFYCKVFVDDNKIVVDDSRNIPLLEGHLQGLRSDTESNIGYVAQAGETIYFEFSDAILADSFLVDVYLVGTLVPVEPVS